MSWKISLERRRRREMAREDRNRMDPAVTLSRRCGTPSRVSSRERERKKEREREREPFAYPPSTAAIAQRRPESFYEAANYGVTISARTCAPINVCIAYCSLPGISPRPRFARSSLYFKSGRIAKRRVPFRNPLRYRVYLETAISFMPVGLRVLDR